MNKILVKFGAAYFESPLMIKYEDIFSHIEVQDINISDNLKLRINEWDEVFQKTFDEEYPPNSCFKTEKDRVSHALEGKLIFDCLQKELGDQYIIEYISEY